MAVTGRPRIEIKPDQFEGLCKLQCTLEEIAGFFYCSPDTIQNFCNREYGQPFSVVYKTFADQGKISLRRYLWKHCEKSAAMCMFMAKNMLGYRDTREPEEPSAEDCNKIANALRDLVNQKGGDAGNGSTDR